jgi:23S rRNA pseudouridine2605 synthase
MRIAKAIAGSGICSRRDAEKLVEAGRVKLNSVAILSPAINVVETDTIEVDGKVIKIKMTRRVWLYHKPAGLITTHKDTHGRDTVFDNIDVGERVISIGRLDMDTEGLLILTNDSEYARFMELPKNAVQRTYATEVKGNISMLPSFIKELHTIDPKTMEPITYSNISIKPIAPPSFLKNPEAGVWLEISIISGKNREVRNICRHYKLFVKRLIRTSYGEYHLGLLKVGQVVEHRPNQS